MRYFVKIGGNENGPVTPRLLKVLADNGQITPTDFVRKAKSDQWYLAGQVKGLFAESMIEDLTVPPDQLAPAPTHRRHRMVWLVVGHIVVGLIGANVVHDTSSPTLQAPLFAGLVFSQTSLLAIWGGLGSTRLWKRLIGVLLGVGYLGCLLGLGSSTQQFGFTQVIGFSFVTVGGGATIVLVLLLIVRFLVGAIHREGLPDCSQRRPQFTVRQLLILTFAIACLVTVGKAVQPFVPQNGLLPFLVRFAVIPAVIGVSPVWAVMAAKRPVRYGMLTVAVVVLAGYSSGRFAYPGVENIWIIATTTEVLVVIVSLLVVRSCGYRLM